MVSVLSLCNRNWSVWFAPFSLWSVGARTPRREPRQVFSRRRGCQLRAVLDAVRGELRLRLGQPLGIRLLAHDLDGDGHEGVVLAAQARALAVVYAFALSLEPCLVQA